MLNHKFLFKPSSDLGLIIFEIKSYLTYEGMDIQLISIYKNTHLRIKYGHERAVFGTDLLNFRAVIHARRTTPLEASFTLFVTDANQMSKDHDEYAIFHCDDIWLRLILKYASRTSSLLFSPGSYDYLFKVVLIGDSGVGKSTCCHALRETSSARSRSQPSA